jgi:hypothetical protein
MKHDSTSSTLERLLRARRLIAAAARLVEEGIDNLRDPSDEREVQIRSLEIKEMPDGYWKVRVNEHPLTLTPVLGLLLAALGSIEGTGPDPGIVPFKTAHQLIAVVSKHRRTQWTERGLAQSLTRLRDKLATHSVNPQVVERSSAEEGYRLRVSPTIGKHLKAVLAGRLMDILRREAQTETQGLVESTS